MADRTYDLVLFGATGFTGGLTATYLAAHLPQGSRWAIAGRNQAKLDAVRASLEGHQPDLLIADAGDPASLRRVAQSARVVATTVGPYLQFGEPLVAACAEAGTDYVDLTGEPEFVDRMYLAHHQTAVSSGARLVHACGFDSIPHDLGALFTRSQLPGDAPVTIRGVVRSNAMISGGTFHSALGQMSRGRQMREAAGQRRAAEPRISGRRTRSQAGRLRRDPKLGVWLMPLPTVDPVIVKRSAAALPEFGPDFTYGHYAGIKRLHNVAAVVGAVAAIAVSAQIAPLRRQLGKRLPQGHGPSEDRRAESFFTVDFIGESGGQSVHTQVRGGDPGYSETAKMLAEAAMCLAFDDNPVTAGQVTTATAMGAHLTQRLVTAGITFEVISKEG